jgi:hypothetical protein
MGWFHETLALVRARYGALVLTAGLALVPANLLVAGAVRFGVGLLGVPDVAQVGDKPRDPGSDAAPPAPREMLKGEAKQSDRAPRSLDPIALLPLVGTIAVGLALLLFGLALAQAALVPLVLGKAQSPTEAWAAVGARMGRLVRTGVLGASLIALGTVLLLLPGVAAMVAFAFAVPAVMVEGVAGSPALDRSWRLMRGRLGAVLANWLLLFAITVASIFLAGLMPPGAPRMIGGTVLRTLAYPLPLVAFIVLYCRARQAEASHSVHPADLGAGIVMR